MAIVFNEQPAGGYKGLALWHFSKGLEVTVAPKHLSVQYVQSNTQY